MDAVIDCAVVKRRTQLDRSGKHDPMVAETFDALISRREEAHRGPVAGPVATIGASLAIKASPQLGRQGLEAFETCLALAAGSRSPETCLTRAGASLFAAPFNRTTLR